MQSSPRPEGRQMTDIQFIYKLEECRPTQRSTRMQTQRERKDHTDVGKITRTDKFIYQINSTGVKAIK